MRRLWLGFGAGVLCAFAAAAGTASGAPAEPLQATRPPDLVPPQLSLGNFPKRCARKRFRIHVLASDETELASIDTDMIGGPYEGPRGIDYPPEAVDENTVFRSVAVPVNLFKKRFRARIVATAEDRDGNVTTASRSFGVCPPRR